MNKKNKILNIISFIIAGACIIVSILLAYIPRNPESLKPAHVSSFEVLEDPSGKLELEEVMKITTGFKGQKKPTFFHSRSYSAFWIKFTIDSPDTGGNSRFLEIDNNNMEQIDIYFPGHSVIKAGRVVNIRNIPVKTRNHNNAIPDDVLSDEPVYIRVQTSTIMQVPVRVLTTAEMVNKTIVETLLFGCFFGIIFAIFFVNLFSFAILKNKNFSIYLLYLFFLFIYHLRVHGFLFTIPIPFDAQKAILWISLGFVGIFMMLFAKEFLTLKKRLPVIDFILNIFIVLFILQTVMGCFFSSFWANQIAYITGFLVPLIIIISTAVIYLKGYKEAHFYLLAWCALFTGTLIWSTAPYAEAQIPGNYFFLIGTSIDSLLFTLAIFDQIKAQLQEKTLIEEREKHYIDLSRTDSLTGLFNRRHLNDTIKRLEAENDVFIRNSVIMIDLDNFKTVNDSFGHPAGDTILCYISAKIKKHVRKTDIACRFGGDEFLLFLPGANVAVARIIAEELRQDILSETCCTETGEKIIQTVSMGISESRENDSFDGILLRADAALYKAKHAGRNCILIL